MSIGVRHPDVRVFEDCDALGSATAAWVAAALADAARVQGAATFVLSGGSTPQIVYRLLAARYKDEVPWRQVDVFWGDERYVPHEDPSSNYRLARQTLITPLDLQAPRVHAMPTHFANPSDAASAYEAALQQYFSGAAPVFDVMLLGIGADGHTASVFAGSPAIATTRVVMAVVAPATPPTRLTLTLPVIARARQIGVLVSGAAKGPALAAAVAGGGDSPAAILARTASSVVWWVDREAWTAAAREQHRGA